MDTDDKSLGRPRVDAGSRDRKMGNYASLGLGRYNLGGLGPKQHPHWMFHLSLKLVEPQMAPNMKIVGLRTPSCEVDVHHGIQRLDACIGQKDNSSQALGGIIDVEKRNVVHGIPGSTLAALWEESVPHLTQGPPLPTTVLEKRIHTVRCD